MTIEEARQLLEYIPADERKQIPDEDFAGKNRTFPCDTQAHLDACATLLGKEPDSEQASIKKKAIAIAKRHGFTLPQTWQDELKDAKESETPPALQSSFQPKQKIATLTVRFLRDGAISKNGRMYPRETVSRLLQSMDEAISNGELLTCYTSHDAADRKDTFAMTGKITRGWREDVDAFAQFDIPDTTAGRDMVSLAQGGYLKNMSLRAKNAELRLERGSSVPVVGGNGIYLEGIDFTPAPGIPQAQIQSVVVESVGTAQSLIEVFDIESSTLLLETEGGLPNVTVTLKESLPMVKNKLEDAHATLHEMCMSAKESGAALSKANTDKIGSAHDAVAMALGIECRYAPDDPNDPATNPVQQPDNDDSDSNSNESEKKSMTPEEAKALLEAAGYKIEAPKSEVELLREQLEAEKAERAAQMARIEELLKGNTGTQQQTQRQSLVESQNVQTEPDARQPRKIYTHGSYLKESLHPSKWADLADRSRPLPEGVDARWALKEMSAFLSAEITERESRMGNLTLI